MLIGNKKCPKCEALYDETLEACPNCGEKNSEQKGTAPKKHLLWLDITHQLVLIFVGSLGLFLFQFLMAFLLKASGVKDEALFVPIATYSAYILTFVALFIVCFTNLKIISGHFNKLAPYLFGIFGGLILVALTIAYTNFVNLFYPIQDSGNQGVAVDYVTRYPFASIIILGFIGPICEEFTYRVGLFTFARRINRAFAYIVTALIFGLIHFGFSNPNIINELINLPVYIISGLFLCFVYERFGVSGSIAAHCTNNLYSVIVILISVAMNK